MHLSSITRPWGKTFTNKRYLHPPLCEKIVTMWSSSMILSGEIKQGNDSQISYNKKQYESALPSCALIFTREGKFLPQYQVKYKVRADGIPIHTLEKPFGSLTFKQQAFCSIERIPKTFIEISISNNTDNKISDGMGIMVKEGAELDLINSNEPDGYSLVEQNIEKWKLLKKFKIKDSNIYNDNNFVLFKVSGQCKAIKDDTQDLVFQFDIEPRQTMKFYFTLSNTYLDDVNYQREKQKALKFWKEELSKAKNFPDNKRINALFNNFISQNLQMFCYPKGCDYVLVRQGGINRYTWPNEAVSMLCAMAQTGGYENYLDSALNTYFNVLQIKEGADKGKIDNYGIQWGAITGAVLKSFAFIANKNKDIYSKYKKHAYQSFLWMEEQRQKTKLDNRYVYGLFPPLKSCDYGDANQIWAYTDIWNLQGYEEYYLTAKKYKDENLKDIEWAYNDYYNSIKLNFDKVISGIKDDDSIIMPNDARNDADIERIIKDQHYIPARKNYSILRMGFAGYNNNLIVKKMLKPFVMQNGLAYAVYPSYEKIGYTWYITAAEDELYYFYKKCGFKTKQKRIISAMLKYAVTNEYYTVERYDDHNAYIIPWLPNASANGRIMSMLFDYYGKKEK